jgi:hypothetical protein
LICFGSLVAHPVIVLISVITAFRLLFVIKVCR